MSVWATVWSIDADDHERSCWVDDDTRPCTCGAGPLAYHGSHVIPSMDGERRGSVDAAVIPDGVTDRPEPFVRLSVDDEVQVVDVVLTRDQVLGLVGVLVEWLGAS